MRHKIKFVLNNEEIEHEIRSNGTLLSMLRDDFDMTGAKEGCGAGECGSCTVLLDGKAVNACLILAVEIEGSTVVTIEGLSKGMELHELQKAFVDNGALQCGYCTPGMILSAKALLDENPHPTEQEIKTALSGNLCRCTGYKKIVEAVQEVANMMNVEARR